MSAVARPELYPWLHFYDAARFCLFEARSAETMEDVLDWILKAEMWRDCARRARRRGR